MLVLINCVENTKSQSDEILLKESNKREALKYSISGLCILELGGIIFCGYNWHEVLKNSKNVDLDKVSADRIFGLKIVEEKFNEKDKEIESLRTQLKPQEKDAVSKDITENNHESLKGKISNSQEEKDSLEKKVKEYECKMENLSLELKEKIKEYEKLLLEKNSLEKKVSDQTEEIEKLKNKIENTKQREMDLLNSFKTSIVNHDINDFGGIGATDWRKTGRYVFRKILAWILNDVTRNITKTNDGSIVSLIKCIDQDEGDEFCQSDNTNYNGLLSQCFDKLSQYESEQIDKE